MKKFKVGFVVTKTLMKSIFAEEDLNYLRQIADINDLSLLPDTITTDFMLETLQDADVAVTCWGTPGFTEDMLARLPRLRLIAHAAGSSKYLVPQSFWDGKHRMFSNAPVIAEDVAQTTLALILTSLKHLWQLADVCRNNTPLEADDPIFQTRRLDGLNVGLVGASLVGREVIRLLKPFHCNILMYDPFLNPFEAEDLGVRLMDLDDLIRESDVLSLHAPANEDCRHMLNARNLPLMKDNALLINTARGMLIDEEALVKELKTGRIMACLDVTDPDPCAADSPLRTLPNVILMPHKAGGHTLNGRRIMGRHVISEICSYLTTGNLKWEVHQNMIQHMA